MDVQTPPPLMTSEVGSYARYTVLERKPKIIQGVIDNNAYPAGIVSELKALRQEIAGQPVAPLTKEGPDVETWNREWAKHQGCTWLQVPWYFAESFFYRRLLEVVRYFPPGRWHRHDPFGQLKGAQDDAAVDWLAEHWDQLTSLSPAAHLETALYSSLWGNRADLSSTRVEQGATGGLSVYGERHNLLIDDSAEVVALLTAGVERVDLVCDNVGRELLADLMLVDLLLQCGWAGRVIMHLKPHPFFISDAMTSDVEMMLAGLRELPRDGAGQVGQRLGRLAAGQLELRSDLYWTSPSMYREMTGILRAELGKSGLVVFKGDLNYRRLLGDVHWPTTVRMEEVASYIPAAFATLRTLKAEIVVGLRPGQAEALYQEDPDWLINGKRGIIQLVAQREAR